MTDDLKLYVMRGCGYCEDVRVAIRDLGLEIEERDITRSREDHDALLAARGGWVKVRSSGFPWHPNSS